MGSPVAFVPQHQDFGMPLFAIEFAESRLIVADRGETSLGFLVTLGVLARN
jgi:hypothetical protein